MYRFSLLLFIATSLYAQQVQNPGLDRPSSVLYYPEKQAFMVSNMKGMENVADGYAEIVLISSPFEKPRRNVFKVLHSNSGKRKDLHAPVKMILDNKSLIVGDSKQIALFDLDGLSLKPKKLIPLPKVKHLKSMALTDNGDLYFTDVLANKLYKVKNLYSAEPEVELASNKIPKPSGMIYRDGRLYILSLSKNLMYVYNCQTAKPERAIKLTSKTDSDGEGFLDLCEGAEGELYLLHKSRESIYLFDLDWSSKRGVRLFKDGVVTPQSIYYYPEKNALMVSQYFTNTITLIPALKSRPSVKE
ncbi:hypothetical protein PQO03_19540 [Lentisphaera profundi]|uniref:SMP-30/Gluconolactonase/LRE-like region domain-containing protein n=1 Tax=Lentisphaera profundi TaxID=1658616 RepID=A0ABY7VWB6_9BACT|nr:hypothetical protein [Lentisphaera profundi]WDE98017.1 hypothetical protein PQO03_19540 [Lentisphaera profundi]